MNLDLNHAAFHFSSRTGFVTVMPGYFAQTSKQIWTSPTAFCRKI